MRCNTCGGRRQVYVSGAGAVSWTDTGGKKQMCPACNGLGLQLETKKRKRKSGGKKEASAD